MGIICYMEWNYTVILNKKYIAIGAGIFRHMEWNYLPYGMEIYCH